MTNPVPKRKKDCPLTSPAMCPASCRRIGLVSVRCVAAGTTKIYSQKKAPGLERPASAVGIGPFGLRSRSRALRARPGANLNFKLTKENEYAAYRQRTTRKKIRPEI
jgi:hypothetical protein